MNLSPMKRKLRAVPRRLREARMFAKAMLSPRHPILAHIIPTRRCNLACAYCNEYDNFSQPVPAEEMLRRVDRLAALGTTIITVSGGEPLLHPQLDCIISRIYEHGIIPTLITNGYLLNPERIRRLNRTGLHQLQISIDNLVPDDISKKSLKVLDQRLLWLADYAEFEININAVVGSGIRNPEDALIIARRAASLGFGITTGVLHDATGQVRPLSDHERLVLDEITKLRKPVFSFLRYNRFQYNLGRGVPNDWHCHAGSRYLYICEEGLVHWCSQQRGYPAIPLDQYSFPEELCPLLHDQLRPTDCDSRQSAGAPARNDFAVAFSSRRASEAYGAAPVRTGPRLAFSGQPEPPMVFQCRFAIAEGASDPGGIPDCGKR
jgi:MoaA/NifB/PqqE/SkfB family radical SAM enzyme